MTATVMDDNDWIFNCRLRTRTDMWVIHSPSGWLGPPVAYRDAWATIEQARAALKQDVEKSVEACKKAYPKAGAPGVVWHSKDDVSIRIGGKEGFHLWERMYITRPGLGVRLYQFHETPHPAAG